jgi:hypothetical protein
VILIFAGEAGLTVAPLYPAVLEKHDPVPPQSLRI